MKHQTLTVENSRIRVTVNREIADKFLPTGVIGRDESPGQRNVVVCFLPRWAN
ncbi:hypothetical protein [Aeromonas hydrophila]|uniref:hypothetical protein n=1 Tax=Aeromonas hydrophila TaxID=644 RepID=UPI00372D7C2E